MKWFERLKALIVDRQTWLMLLYMVIQFVLGTVYFVVVLRPAFAAALVASLAFSVWAPLSRYLNVEESGLTPAASVVRGEARLPAWTPLPDVAEDEGLAVLAEWTPTEDELTIARCRASCLAGLSSHEEERLLSAVAMNTARAPLPLPITGASPL